jgi:hypothetical protein
MLILLLLSKKPPYHLETATCHKLDTDSGRTKDSGARLTYELRNYVTTLVHIFSKINRAESNEEGSFNMCLNFRFF